MSVNEKLYAEEAPGYGSIAPEPENDAVAYVKRHTIALGALCVLAFGAAVAVDRLEGRDKNGVPLDAAAAALPPTPSASAFSCNESARHMRLQLEGRGREQLLRHIMDSSTATPPSGCPPSELV